MASKLLKAGAVILVWFAANLLGVAASAGLSLLSPYLTFIPGILLSSLIIGLPIGFAQWIALRRAASIFNSLGAHHPCGSALVIESQPHPGWNSGF